MIRWLRVRWLRVRWLAWRGHSAAEIARRVGVTINEAEVLAGWR